MINIISSDKGIKEIIIGDVIDKNFEVGDPFNACSQIKKYFESGSKEFNLPLDIDVSPFAGKVLIETFRIPYGKTSTYGEIAAAIGNPKAFRAVGGALNQNPVPIIIPCHRVLAKGSLGGFALGNDIKIKLLKHEGVQTDNL